MPFWLLGPGRFAALQNATIPHAITSVLYTVVALLLEREIYKSTLRYRP